MEAHNGLTGLIVENVAVETDNKLEQFDGIRVYCDTANAIDVQLGILKGVS